MVTSPIRCARPEVPGREQYGRAVLVLGLTGGIGSGKSTVSSLLEERGAVIIDADRVVRDLQRPGEPVFEAMVEAFGPGIVAADGTLEIGRAHV